MKKILSILAAALLLTACEKQIDIDIENSESMVVVKALNEAGNPLVVDLTYSRPTFGSFYVRYGEDYFPKVTDATVTLSIDGGAVDTATRNGGTYTFAHIPQTGEELKLTVSVPGHDEVTASATVPAMPTVSAIDTSNIGNGYNYDYYNPILNTTIHFTITDPMETADFYSVRLREVASTIITQYDSDRNIISRDTSVDDNYMWFSCTDYLLVNSTDIDDVLDVEDPTASTTYYGREMLFTDATINGQSHRIRIAPEYGFSYEYIDYDADSVEHTTIVTLYLEVTALSRDIYLYRQTMNNYDYDEILSFFSEPIQVHSNINGGIGIFGVSTKTVNKVFSVTLQ